MPSFGAKSERCLRTLHPDLQRVLRIAIQYIDFSITWGFRNKYFQNLAKAEGFSTKGWPNSKHNITPNTPAFDFTPYPLDWNDLAQFGKVAGVITTIAMVEGVELIWGGDWDNDGRTLDERLRDYGHFQLKG